MVEFDGENQESLLKALNFGDFSADNRYLFSFENADGKVKLNRSKMILETGFLGNN